MKILHAIAGLGEAAGTSVFAVEIARALQEAGHECAIAVCADAMERSRAQAAAAGVRLLDIETALEAESWDFVHIHALWSWPLHRLAAKLRRRKIPYAASPHGMLTPWALDFKKWRKRLALRLYQKRDLECAAFLHATAPAELEDIRRLGLSNPVSIAPLGVSIPRFHDSTIPRFHDSKILYLGRLQKKKGVLNLVEAWARVRRKGWKIVVAGPDQEGYLAEIKNLAAKRGVLEDFEFPGPVFGEAKERLYSEAAFFVLPSFSENFGSVVVESLAAGTPVVATKGTPWQELETRACGLWIDIGAAPLAEALGKMMDTPPAALAEMGRRGLALVREKYTWQAAAAALEKYYRQGSEKS